MLYRFTLKQIYVQRKKRVKIKYEIIDGEMCLAWYLYQMVTQNMLRTQEGKYVFLDKNNPICDCSQSNKKP